MCGIHIEENIVTVGLLRRGRVNKGTEGVTEDVVDSRVSGCSRCYIIVYFGQRRRFAIRSPPERRISEVSYPSWMSTQAQRGNHGRCS